MRYLMLLGAVALAIAGYTVYWTLLADRIEARIAGARGAQGGVTLDYAEAGVRGYPYRLAVEIGDASARASDGRLWSWRVPDLTVYLQPWNLGHAIAEADGPQELVWNGGPMPFSITATPGTALVSARREDGALGRVIVDYRDVAVSGREGPVAHLGRALAETYPSGPGDDRPGLRAGVSLEAIEVLAGGIERLGLGATIGRASAFLRFEGLARPDDLARIAQRLRAGRTLAAEVVDLAFDWGPFSVTGTGYLMLDAEHRPEGTLLLRIAGHEETVERLVASGVLDPDAAANLRTALGMLGALGGDSQGRVPVPVRIADGAVHIGPVRVATLPPLF